MKRVAAWAVAFGAALGTAGGVRADDEEVVDHSDDEVPGKDFSRREMPGARFRNADAKRANFSGAVLTKAEFYGADLTEAKFDDADLTGADLRTAKLRYATFWDADLSGANLEGQDFTGVKLGRVKLAGANLRKLKAIGSCEAADFRGADLRGADLTGLTDDGGKPSKWRGAYYDATTKWPAEFDPDAKRLVRVARGAEPAPANHVPPRPAPPERDFHEKELKNRKFGPQPDLAGATFWRADVSKTRFDGTVLSLADFTEADLDDVEFAGCDLSGADFTGATLRACTFRDCKLAGAKLGRVDFANAYVKGVDFSGADLRGVSGFGSVSDTTFAGADLRGADLRTLRNGGGKPLTFTGATYDGRTRWPSDLDPESAGAVRR